jgi:hypothetical protein
METVDGRSDIDELCAVRRLLTVWRTGLFALIALLVLVCTFLMQNTIANLARKGQPRDEFVQQVGLVMQRSILPQIQDVGAEAVRSVDFNREISQLNKRAPEVANASMKELRLLARNIPTSGKKVLAQEFDNALQKQAVALKTQFPEASEAEITDFLAEFTSETQTQLTGITDTLFTPHITAMNNIVADLQIIQALEGPAAKGEVPTWEMAFLIADIARADIEAMTAPTPTDAGKEKAR